MTSFITDTFINLDEEEFKKKIEKLNDYIVGEPSGHLPEIMKKFSTIIHTIKNIKNMDSLDQFFEDDQGKSFCNS